MKDEAREIALAEARAVQEHVSDPEYAEQLASLIDTIEQGEVPESAADVLARVLELALQAGRIRAVYGPGGEQVVLRLYRKLPAGAAVAASADQVSHALGSLAGKELEWISLRAIGPGSYALSLTAGGVELTVRLDRQGARLASVAL